MPIIDYNKITGNINNNTSAVGYMVAIGDSLIGNHASFGGTVPAYTTFTGGRGFLWWFQALMNNPFEMPVAWRGAASGLPLGSMQGIGGQFTRQGLARLQSDALAQEDVTDIWWNFGTNDIKNDYTAPNVFSNTVEAFHATMRSGIVRFWCPAVFPRNNDQGVDFTTAQEAERIAYNNLLQNFAAANPGRFIYIPCDAALVDPATGKLRSDYSYDGLHPNARGAYVFAKQCIIPAWQALGGGRFPSILTPAYNASTNPFGNLLANGAFVGTAGTAGTGASGSVPTDYTLSRSAGTQATVVSSIVSEANGSGVIVNKARLAMSSNGTSADTEVIQLRPTTTDITTGIFAGNWYEAQVEIDIEALTGNEIIRSFYIEIRDMTTNGERSRSFSTRYSSGVPVKDIWMTANPDNLVLKTPPICIRGTTGVRVSVNIDIDGTVSGSRTIKVSSPVVKNVVDPWMKVYDRNGPQLLFAVFDADMQSTADRIFEKRFRGSGYLITDVRAVRKSGGTSVACAGGIYTAASKGGTALVAAAQSWVTLTGSGKSVRATVASAAETDFQTATPFFSLTTGSTAAATADIYIYGYVVT